MRFKVKWRGYGNVKWIKKNVICNIIKWVIGYGNFYNSIKENKYSD